jgi:hypothetical protein
MMMMMIELVGGGRFRWLRYSEGLAVVCLKTVGIKMEESAKEGSDGEVRWMDGWMVSYGSGMVLGKVEGRGN